MSATGVIALLVATWLVTFLILFFPGRWLGSWIAKRSASMFVGILFCIGFGKLFVVYVAVFLVFARLSFLPHVNGNTGGFGVAFVGLLFFVPAFAALILGFRRAQAAQRDFLQPATSQ
jgi:hypothetical protein